MSPEEMDELSRLLAAKEVEIKGRMAMCSGKGRFPTFDIAKRSINAKGVTAYHCPPCHKYHVGTPARDRKLGIKGRITRLQEKSREMDEEVAA